MNTINLMFIVDDKTGAKVKEIYLRSHSRGVKDTTCRLDLAQEAGNLAVGQLVADLIVDACPITKFLAPNPRPRA